MSSWAKPGVQCVCIDDNWPHVRCGPCQLPVRLPMKGEVLTVKKVTSDHASVPYSETRAGVFLVFEEVDEAQCHIVDGHRFCADCISWAAGHFRPLIKRPTDISIFKAMLTPAPKQGVPA